MESKAIEKYKEWLNSSIVEAEDKKELENIREDQNEIEERFYKNIEFGTGGMRGIRGVGTNRINKYMIGKATQGLANYMLRVDEKKAKSQGVVIAHDCRIGSKEYTLETALVLAANGIKTYVFDSLRSTPELSFAVRELKTQAGIVITASHNPVEYNGYKVYWNDGGQIVEPHANGIVGEVDKVENLEMIKKITKEEAIEKGLFEVLTESQDDKYIEAIKKEIITENIKGKKDFKIVYSPLHGTGRVGVQRILKEAGFDSVYTVKEQEMPDGNFPTCSYANPEDPNVFKLGIELANEVGADICMTNDPDADRIGIALKNKKNEWVFPNGNELGLLLFDYILENKKDIKENATVVTTIVSTPMIDVIAKDKNIKLIKTLTGFKYIGEKIGQFERKEIDGSYLFGFEESYGYLIGTHARDKDAIVISLIVAEMAAKYTAEGTSILEKLEDLYEKYGWHMAGISAITKGGKSGAEEISNIISTLRNETPKEINNSKVVTFKDFKLGIEKNFIENTEKKIDLPSSNVLQFILDDETHITVRPSGTEPKIKYYYGVKEDTKEKAKAKLKTVTKNFEELL